MDMALSKTNTVASGIKTEELYGGPISEKTMGFSVDAVDMLTQRMTDLYPDPIEAAVRETISNAVDATMLLAPEDRKPVDIYTPTLLDPYFSVEDHGVGMSIDDVNNHFSEYGASTKEKNLDAIGAYGLGSKSPLAYTTSFTVITVQDGHEIDFSMDRESNKNVMRIFNEAEVDKPNGTMVKIPTQTKDVYKFVNSAKKYAEYADDNVPIAINGDASSFGDNYSYLMDILLDEDDHAYGQIYYRKGQLDSIMSSFVDESPKSFVSKNFISVLSGWPYRMFPDEYAYRNTANNMVLVIKPGMVDFSSSRDSITKNERLDAIISKLEEKFSLKDNPETVVKAMFGHLDNKDIPRIMNLVIRETQWHNRINGLTLLEHLMKMFPIESRIFDRKFKMPAFNTALKFTVSSHTNDIVIDKPIIFHDDRNSTYRMNKGTRPDSNIEFKSIFETKDPESVGHHKYRKWSKSTIGVQFLSEHESDANTLRILIYGERPLARDLKSYIKNVVKDDTKFINVVYTYTMRKKPSKRITKLIKSYHSDIRIVSFDELKKYLASKKKQKPKPQAERLPELAVRELDGYDSGLDLYHRVAKEEYKSYTITDWSDLIKDNAEIYIGAFKNTKALEPYISDIAKNNDPIDASGKRFVFVDSSNGRQPMFAKVFKELEGYGHLHVMSTAGYRVTNWKIFENIDVEYTPIKFQNYYDISDTQKAMLADDRFDWTKAAVYYFINRIRGDKGYADILSGRFHIDDSWSDEFFNTYLCNFSGLMTDENGPYLSGNDLLHKLIAFKKKIDNTSNHDILTMNSIIKSSYCPEIDSNGMVQGVFGNAINTIVDKLLGIDRE
jgi:hypothetical protein